MKGILIIFGIMAGLTSCSPDNLTNVPSANMASTSNDEFLKRCWAAVETAAGSGEFELSFEALMIPGMEGGTFARSRTCPEARLGLRPIPPEEQERWQRIADSVRMPMLGAGLRGRMRIVPQDRRTPYFLRVRVKSFIELEQMNEQETQSFIDEFNIG